MRGTKRSAPKRRTSLPRPTKPLKRSAPPRRKRRSNRRSPASRYANRARDLDFLAFVRLLPCAVAWDLGHRRNCRRRTEADHARNAGMSRKCEDKDSLPLCGQHHYEKTHYTGHFAGWTPAQREEWLDDKVSAARSAHLASKGAL